MSNQPRCKPNFPVQYRVATYSLNPDDAGTEIQFDSSSAVTANLPAVVDARNGYNVLFRNIGTADLTVDPSGSEQIDGASTSVLAAGQWRWIRSDGTSWKTISRYVPSASGAGDLPLNYLSGLILSNAAGDPNHDIEVTVGSARDSANSADMALTSALTKQLDATWASGNNAGGLPSSLSPAADTTYHVFLLSNADGTTVDVGFDTSLTATNLLADAAVISAGLTKHRRVGSRVTDGSSDFFEVIQFGDTMLYNDPSAVGLDFSALHGNTAQTVTLTVPTGIQVIAAMHVSANQARASLLTSLATADLSPSRNATPLANIGGNSGSISVTGDLYVLTNVSGQIRLRQETGSSTTLSIQVFGFTDLRGKDS